MDKIKGDIFDLKSEQTERFAFVGVLRLRLRFRVRRWRRMLRRTLVVASGNERVSRRVVRMIEMALVG